MTPIQRFDPSLLLRAQGIKGLLLDVDGVMTDGGLYVGEAGESFKRFHTLDGYGLRLLRLQGFVLMVVSGKDSASLRKRLSGLKIDRLQLGADPKRPAAEALLREAGLSWAEVAVAGDDWPDAALMSQAGLAFAPPSAHPEIQHLAHHVTQAPAGAGAVREICDVLLMAKGVYAQTWQDALNGRVGE
jgi:3-deoxy-D-manno-octulosonate 8-phosphate phosphatase (KDO 8-P phosphatase)